MKPLRLFACLLILCWSQGGLAQVVQVDNNVDANLGQNVQVVGGGDADATSISEGGDAFSQSSSQGGDASAKTETVNWNTPSASISTTTTSNYRSNMSPSSLYPGALPYWTHGGWGIIKGYCPKSPSSDFKAAYEQKFGVGSLPFDDLENVIRHNVPPDGVFGFLECTVNDFFNIFGTPDRFHRGRGFEITSSLIPKPRPKDKPLYVFENGSHDKAKLREMGFIYVGKVGVKGKLKVHNWDHCEDAAVAEAYLYDVDFLFISGGMRGVTVGSTGSLGAGGAYGVRSDLTVNVIGVESKGMVEGEFLPLADGEAYRYDPKLAGLRSISNDAKVKVGKECKPISSLLLDMGINTAEDSDEGVGGKSDFGQPQESLKNGEKKAAIEQSQRASKPINGAPIQ